VAELSEHELGEFERLIDVPDRDLLAWITGEEAVPADFDSTLFRDLCAFRLSPGAGG
jgi:antitoxin CptB